MPDGPACHVVMLVAGGGGGGKWCQEGLTRRAETRRDAIAILSPFPLTRARARCAPWPLRRSFVPCGENLSSLFFVRNGAEQNEGLPPCSFMKAPPVLWKYSKLVRQLKVVPAGELRSWLVSWRLSGNYYLAITWVT